MATTFPSLFLNVPLSDQKTDYNQALFLVTNESNQQHLLGFLSQNTIVGDTAIGVSGLFTLNAVAVRGIHAPSKNRIKRILLLDCSSRVERFWNFMKQTLCENIPREEAIAKIQSHVWTLRGDYWPNRTDEMAWTMITRLAVEIQYGVSFLSNDEKYHKIRQIFADNGFVFKRIDLFSPLSCTAISSALRTGVHTVDMVYLSNVSECVFGQDEKIAGFSHSVRELVDDNTLVIHSKSSKTGIHPAVYRRKPGHEVNEAVVKEVFSLRFTTPELPYSPAIQKAQS